MRVAAPTVTESNVANAKDIFARVFVPVDFTMSSRHSLGVALELKQSFGSQVCIFQLAEEGGADEFLAGLGAGRTPGDMVSSARGRLRRFLENVAPGVADSVEVRAAIDVKPIEDIREEARRWGATLVVVATAFEGMFRSPAEKLVHGFDIPILLIPSVWEEVSIKPVEEQH